jgi:putative SOS response-associated peptidase YedK
MRWYGGMCNAYSHTTNQEAMRRLFGVGPERDRTGNLPPLPGIFPDQLAPVVRTTKDGSERELLTMRWGLGTISCSQHAYRVRACRATRSRSPKRRYARPP